MIVLLRGPIESVTTRRKDRLLGLWVNRAQATFADVPAFYALHAIAPLAQLAEPRMLAGLGLGLSTIIAVTEVDTAERRDFATALVRLRRDQGHYYERFDQIGRPSTTVFRTSFDLPANVPIGDYMVQVYLFRSGELAAFASLPMEIIKTGGEQLIFDASRDSPWLYGLVIILVAVAAGWLGGVVFRRD